MSQTINTDLSTLEMPEGNYRIELVRTLAHVFQRAQRTEVAKLITSATIRKFKSEMSSLSTADLEKRVYAIQMQNPELLLLAMKDAGHKIEVDGDGNIAVGQPSDLRGLLGKPVYINPEDYE